MWSYSGFELHKFKCSNIKLLKELFHKKYLDDSVQFKIFEIVS